MKAPECSNASIFDECAGEVLDDNAPLDLTPEADVPAKQPDATPVRTFPPPAVRLPLYAVAQTHLAPLQELRRPTGLMPHTSKVCPTHGPYTGQSCEACEKYQLGRKQRWQSACEAFWSIQV